MLELPKEKWNWPSYIYKELCLDKIVPTKEDLIRSQDAVNNRKRKEIMQKVSKEDLVKSLKLKVMPQDEVDVKRVEQLFQRTNQFNSRGRRLTADEVRQYIIDGDKKLFSYNISDRFGEYGVCSAVTLERHGETWIITDYLVSCRVRGRSAEMMVLEDVKSRMKEEACEVSRIIGRKTGKNTAFMSFINNDLRGIKYEEVVE